MSDLPIPYTDYLYIEPVSEVGIISTTLNCYAKVLATGPLVKETQIGDYVAFEKWDKPEFLDKNGEVRHFLRESEAICKLPSDWI